MRKNPLLSVIIPTYNEEKNIDECIRSLKKQSYKHFEIIIVDDGSNDKTVEIIKNLKKKERKIRLFRQEHKGPGEARNLGAEHAKGEILILVDCDMRFDKAYLINLIQPILNEEEIGTEEARQTAFNKENIWSQCWGKYFFDYSHHERGQIFRAIKKDKFLELGGFDAKYGYGDDRTFYYKYGLTSKRVKEAINYHKNPETLKEVYKQSGWIGGSLENIFIKMPIIKYFIPLFLILLFPLVIPIAIRKSVKIKNLKIFFPWMLVFMTIRYFGTVRGLFRKIYLNKNVR